MRSLKFHCKIQITVRDGCNNILTASCDILSAGLPQDIYVEISRVWQGDSSIASPHFVMSEYKWPNLILLNSFSMSQWKTLAGVLPVMIYKFTHNILSVEFVFQLYQVNVISALVSTEMKTRLFTHIYMHDLCVHALFVYRRIYVPYGMSYFSLFSSYFISFNWWSFERDQTGFATSGTIDNQFLIPPPVFHDVYLPLPRHLSLPYV